MAKRKTPKTVDLKPKAEKITEEQLKNLRQKLNIVNNFKIEIGNLEVSKQHILSLLFNTNKEIEGIRTEFIKEYGTDDINLADGTIKYNENGIDKTDTKDNSR